jgi:hypothetical protein
MHILIFQGDLTSSYQSDRKIYKKISRCLDKLSLLHSLKKPLHNDTPHDFRLLIFFPSIQVLHKNFNKTKSIRITGIKQMQQIVHDLFFALKGLISNSFKNRVWPESVLEGRRFEKRRLSWGCNASNGVK